MITSRKKAINVVLAGTGILLFAYAYYSQFRSAEYKKSYDFGKEVIAHTAPTNNTAMKRALAPESEATRLEPDSAQVRLPMSLAESQELILWNKARGYPSVEENGVYEAYSQQNLQQLSGAGDVRAMMVLAERYRKNGQRNEYVSELYKAAVFGATTPFPDLANDAMIEMMRSRTDETPDGREIGVIEIMAYYKVAGMRGDPRLSIPYMSSYQERYKRLYKEDLVLTPDYLDKIDLRAQAIYDDMQATRRKFGLGDFDNSTPKALKKSYGLE